MMPIFAQVIAQIYQFLGLDKRFTSRNNNMFTIIFGNFLDSFINRYVFVFRFPTGVWRITPNTTKVTIASTKEDRRDAD